MPSARPRSMVRRPLDLAPRLLALRIGSWAEPALLEGAPGLGDAGRWSILAARPRRIFESPDGSSFRWRSESLDLEITADALEGLATIVENFGLARSSDDPGLDSDPSPFRGGLIGYLGYDLSPRLERLPRQAEADSRLPALRFGLYDTFVLLDHREGTGEIRAVGFFDEGPEELEERCDRWQADLLEPYPPRTGSALGPALPSMSLDDYRRAIATTLKYINAGDIYQANLSHRFSATGQVDALDLYDNLKRISPAPFSAFLAWDDLALLSASPELFYRTEGERIMTRPIKGTRPRSEDPTEDARLAAELTASAKDRAELTMIVDLERNDLGKVCRFGSVQVAESWRVESFEQVHHLVATIEGRLRPEVGPVEIVRAVFPGGSITGAPKIRAMEIIDELEPNRRSAYTGAIGYFSLGGLSSFNIAIRTMLVEGDRVSYQVGGGIVADSDPELEYVETLDKARGMAQVLEQARGDR